MAHGTSIPLVMIHELGTTTYNIIILLYIKLILKLKLQTGDII